MAGQLIQNGASMTVSPEPSPRPRVIAAVFAQKGHEITDVLKSIDAQVYGLEDVVVVSDHPIAVKGEDSPPKRVRSMAEALALAGDEVEYLWILDSRVTARPDALEALVSTAGQVDASVVGSKILDAANSQTLLSVGGTTDVFGFPYTGLDRGELDQEQFDVIRDVAYVEPASLLVRKDLAEGLRGPDHKLPYIATGLDLCQRARVVGGRVVVAPTSEVFSRVSGEDRVHTWREQAGRIRVMMKTYSIVTLIWAIPSLLMLGLLSGLHRTAQGNLHALWDWLSAWLWNARHLPSTMTARRRAPAISTASDAELFRFQVRGSVELRAMASSLGALLGSGTDPEDAEVYDASPAFWQRPAVITTALGAGFVVVLIRSILMEGLPATGFVLPLADSAWNTLRAYAGGWHLGGLGSAEPMHPSVGATAAVQLLLGNRGAAAAAILTVASVASGMAGIVALVKRAGFSPRARLVAGMVFVAGFPMLVLAGEGYWPGLLAMGGLPWALAGIALPPPSGAMGWTRRLARIGLATAWSAVFVPLVIVVPVIFGVIWAVAARNYVCLLIAPAGSVLAIPSLLPWLIAQDPVGLVASGVPLHVDPVWWVSIPVLVAGLAAVLSGLGRSTKLAMVGLIIGSVGLFAARAASLGAGRDVTVIGLLMAALGMALVVAGALDGPPTLVAAGFMRRVLAHVGVAAAALVGLSALVALPAGRMGLPDDRFGGLAFAESRAQQHGPDRILLAGPGDTLPGEYRRLPDGSAYRLIGGLLDYPQAWLPQPLEGDTALEMALIGLGSEGDLRPGERLAGYGIGWVVLTGPSRLVGAMSTQLDLRPLGGLIVGESGGVWENEVEAYRAVTDLGVPWSWVAPDYKGRSYGGTVRINENADPRWGPGEWEQTGWANQVSAGSEVAFFSGVESYRRLAQMAGVWFAVLAVSSLGFRSTRSRGRPL